MSTSGRLNRPANWSPVPPYPDDEAVYNDRVAETQVPKSVRRYHTDAQPPRQKRQDTEPAKTVVPAGVVRAGTLNREKSTRSVTQHPMKDQHQVHRVRTSSNFKNAPRSRWRPHWILGIGIGMLVMLGLWMLLTASEGWINKWRASQDDPSKYGTVQGTKVETKLGGDGEKQPSVLQSYNIDGQVGVIVFYGGDNTKTKNYACGNPGRIPNVVHANVDITIDGDQISVIAIGDWKDNGYTHYTEGCNFYKHGDGGLYDKPLIKK